MVGLDTNVLVRYLAQDDVKQSAAATRLIESGLSDRVPGYLSVVVVVELCWVLQRLYAASAAEVAESIDDMLAMPVFVFQEREAVQAAVGRVRARGGSRLGLPDMLITELATRAGCDQVMSFDRNAVRSAGMTLLA